MGYDPLHGWNWVKADEFYVLESTVRTSDATTGPTGCSEKWGWMFISTGCSKRNSRWSQNEKR